MKKLMFLFINLVLILTIGFGNNALQTKVEPTKQTSINVMCSPDLFELTSNWATVYNNLNPDVTVKVTEFQDNKVSDLLKSESTIGFVSSEYVKKTEFDKLWSMVIGRDIVVPIINSENPYLQLIKEQGLSPEEISKILENPENQNWGTLFGTETKDVVNVYLPNDETIQRTIAEFLGKNSLSVSNIRLENPAEIIAKVQQNPNAIGFCKLTDVINQEDLSTADNISLLPIDKNGNGSIDHFESIYNDLNEFSRGVWIGKYPNKLVSNIYSVSSEKPENTEAKAFLKWVLSDGQQFMIINGFSELIGSERQSKIEKLTDPMVYPYAPVDKYAGWKAGVVVFLVLMLFTILISSIILYKKYEKQEQMSGSGIRASVFNENSVEAPGGLLYDKSHTWVFMERDGSVKIGIDDFLPKVTGKITDVKMMKPGEKVKKGDIIVTLIQNGKKLLVHAPISGTIKEQNDDLYDNSILINSSPYAEGWVYIVEPTNWLREIQFLFRAEKFKTWLKAEFSRLKDFFAITLSSSDVKPAYLILQEGGELNEGLLSEFGPVVWEDFQTNFIETTV